MKRVFLFCFTAILFLSCGNQTEQNKNSDSLNVNPDSLVNSVRTVKELVAFIKASTSELKIPVLIHSDSLFEYKPVSISVEEARVLMPETFEAPDGFEFSAIAHYTVGAKTDGLLCRMLVRGADDPGTNDIFLLLYNTEKGSVQQALILSNMDMGYSYSLLDKANHFRQVSVDEMELINVNTAVYSIRNGEFTQESSADTSFKGDEENYKLSRAYMKEFMEK